ncbi:thiamine phosphate synthase [Pikeienuella piscinae]|uniref:thiamine phosphate synthase n=1 Tax=Pikeienuella piscinae TaxID=2748098 RepID=UPI0015D1C800|nr:thiamine phosphate synthase [Pikeienuella piscinae]
MDESRLYLVTPPLSDGAAFAPALESALSAAPVACLRLRIAADDEALIRRVADPLREICHSHDVAIVVTDHFRMVRALGLDGVHLANPRLNLREVRKTLGADAIVGGFAGCSRHQGMMLAEAGADYVAFGPVAHSELGDGQVADENLFAWWSEMITTPVVAEGGMNIERAAIFAAHADFIAVESAVWDHAEGAAAGVRAFSALLDTV